MSYLLLPLLLLLLACPGGHIEGAYQENQLPACRILKYLQSRYMNY
jgi:hypothetical protein